MTRLCKIIAAAALLALTAVAGHAQPRRSTERFSLRTNLLYWAAATPNIGAEWRISDRVGLLADGAWSHWTWQDGERRYFLWAVQPELRLYPFTCQRWYLGGEFHAGSLNLKTGDTGRQGDFMGGGLTAGYKFRMTRSLDLDLGLGLGATRWNYDEYYQAWDHNVRGEQNLSKTCWGITKANVTLCWKICK